LQTVQNSVQLFTTYNKKRLLQTRVCVNIKIHKIHSIQRLILN